ncbi:WecB/TagA/CpsF family glycosyltransferase [Sphingobium sp.]|uniref:WecB/TagA/CpsF family glycosyltransferase n=1 Tax=Sphingobium sp. TaxID=1912891 RepID=UPI000DAF9BC3|nr:WecB/TagA/CpsF family glycosyltransferase [Sphingobium sp.]PZU62882.1 MAG: glycosyl transferase [Sphingobium sp.]
MIGEKSVKDNKYFDEVIVGGLPTVRATRSELASLMVDDCLKARSSAGNFQPKLVFSSNGQGVSLAGQNPNFLKTMMEASWIHADGQSVVFASKLTKTPLPERVATTDFFHDAANAAIENKLSFFILGGSESQNSRAVEKMKKLYPSLIIAGRRNGYFHAEEDEEVCKQIKNSGADVLWVGLGKPFQEEWCVKNKDKLNGIGWIKTCGGLYAFLCGDSPRAPSWMQEFCLEWLFRSLKDPKRLLWRYATTNPHSIYRLIRYTRTQ